MHLILSNSRAFLQENMNGLDHPARLQIREANSVKSLFSLLFSQEGFQNDMRSQILSGTEPCLPRARADTLGLQRAKMSRHCTGTYHMVTKCYKANMATLHESSTLQVAVCRSLWKESCVFILTPVMYTTFTPQLKFCSNLHSPNTFLITQAKHRPRRIQDVS